MLVLSRNKGERILFELPGLPPMVVTVLGRGRYGYQLGIDAPREVKITREELTRGAPGNERAAV